MIRDRAGLNQLLAERAERSRYDWLKRARPNQQLPTGDWTTWLIIAGRGWGKTRTLCEALRLWVREFEYVNLMGATMDDARQILIEGESGILRICPDAERPEYLPSKRELRWPNGSTTLIFTADEPERLRGKQHQKLIVDELMSWRWPEEALDQARFGLRLGPKPQMVIGTTPRPSKLLRDLIGEQTTVVTRGTSFENKRNLAPSFYAKIVSRYEGTRLGQQELQGEILEDNPGALWNLSNIDQNRIARAPSDVSRIVVAIDPAVTANESSDETGIVCCAVDDRTPPHFYVLDDLSLIASPDAWARRAVIAYHRHRADRLVAEVNNGGDMVEACIRHIDPNVAYKTLHASRGKVIRAEPIAALYEQNRVHHVGTFAALESQMCEWNPESLDSPDRMDALVWALTELSEGYGGTHGLIEYFSSGMAARDLKRMVFGVPAQDSPPPELKGRVDAGVTPTITCSEPPPPPAAAAGARCPKCNSTRVVRVSGQVHRCTEPGCGQMFEVQGKFQIERGPSRADVLAMRGGGRWMR